MRFGGPVMEKWLSPEDWAGKVRRLGYSAAYCPAGVDDPDELVAAYAAAASEAGIVIAEVGAWSNPLSRDDAVRAAAMDKCKRSLALADRIGARCCVNIAGSRGTAHHGPARIDLTAETFDMIVACVREIIDAVRPTRTYYALETMPWLFPDSTDSYVRLIEAIDRERFAAHFDPVNLVCSPRAYFDNAGLIREFVAKLGPHIRSAHAKDTLIADRLTIHLDEVAPGKGELDYHTFLTELDGLGPDACLMMEHLRTPEQYAEAAAYIRSVADDAGVRLT